MKIFIMTSILLFSANSFAKKVNKIDFPEEELARESVLPVFDTKLAIKNRRINHAKKLEFNLLSGMVMSEALYDPFHFGASLTYHLDNTRAIHIIGAVYGNGLQDRAKQLRDGEVVSDSPGCTVPGDPGCLDFDASQAPTKEFLLAAHYQYNAYYGKISLSKENVMNLTLSGLIGGGFYMIGSTPAPTFNFGISQRLYFTKKLALRVDLMFSLYNGIDLTSSDQLQTDTPAPDESDFDSAILFDSSIMLGLSFLL